MSESWFAVYPLDDFGNNDAVPLSEGYVKQDVFEFIQGSVFYGIRRSLLDLWLYIHNPLHVYIVYSFQISIKK